MLMLIRNARPDDIDEMNDIERFGFDNKRPAHHNFNQWIRPFLHTCLVAEINKAVVAYIFIAHHPGSRMACIHSIVVAHQYRGLGLAKKLIMAGEQAASDNGDLYLRIEVSESNLPAIKLYESQNYKKLNIYRDYYHIYNDTFFYQKNIHGYYGDLQYRPTHWLRQTTPFTCGPASLMMAMHSISKSYHPSQEEEINLWREATTVFMTSGHGGCHPIGLALAAKRRDFSAEVWINRDSTLFIDGVRNNEKKQVIELVDNCFRRQASEQDVFLKFSNISRNKLITAFKSGAVPLILISTFLIDGKKAPHWVVMSGFDDNCLYIHDPDPDSRWQSEIDCQFIPVANRDFDKMFRFGKSRLRAAVIIWPMTSKTHGHSYTHHE